MHTHFFKAFWLFSILVLTLLLRRVGKPGKEKTERKKSCYSLGLKLKTCPPPHPKSAAYTQIVSLQMNNKQRGVKNNILKIGYQIRFVMYCSLTLAYRLILHHGRNKHC